MVAELRGLNLLLARPKFPSLDHIFIKILLDVYINEAVSPVPVFL
jgi:hypothetical protein